MMKYVYSINYRIKEKEIDIINYRELSKEYPLLTTIMDKIFDELEEFLGGSLIDVHFEIQNIEHYEEMVISISKNSFTFPIFINRETNKITCFDYNWERAIIKEDDIDELFGFLKAYIRRSRD